MQEKQIINAVKDAYEAYQAIAKQEGREIMPMHLVLFNTDEDFFSRTMKPLNWSGEIKELQDLLKIATSQSKLNHGSKSEEALSVGTMSATLMVPGCPTGCIASKDPLAAAIVLVLACVKLRCLTSIRGHMLIGDTNVQNLIVLYGKTANQQVSV